MMDDKNHSVPNEFILLGLTDNPMLKAPLFALFLLAYILTLLGNLGIIVLIQLDPHLHTPMYFFLCQLSFVDICFSSDITPKMLIDLLAKEKRISVTACVTQLFIFCTFGSTEALLLAAMAYDRYVAVCRPLRYATIMTKSFCVWLMAGVLIGGFVHSMIETGCTFRLSFCRWEIHHFCCDVPPLLKLSCVDTYFNEVVMFICAGFLVNLSLLVVLVSYASIILAVLQMRSSTGLFRVLSTCGSHFIGVTLYFGTILFTYIRPSSSYSLDQDKAVTLFYTVVIPLLNPLIYSLRNKDVKAAFRKTVAGTGHVQR
ncbi:olfactory receptor 5AR1-like [Ambystoma mexicanum]|uniref:olfactory receptor 5AR1-like n=1 Tax=Ambystoma mexicanum TaxID=8296 RepID=UPI0037E7767D